MACVILAGSWSLPRQEPVGNAYLALGDSYTIGESVDPDDRYPVRTVRLLREDHVDCTDPEIIATTGWTTADLLDALGGRHAAAPYAMVTLLIGVNNQFQGLSQSAYRTQFAALLERSIRLAGNRPSHVLALSIPDYSVTPFARDLNGALISSQIDSFNTINAALAAKSGVHYLDLTSESRKGAEDPSLIAGDSLHFSGKEYAIWAGMMKPVMKTILMEK
ncbi:MAG: GDSL-type esterase/lipase family protein [Bacteroidota bacterium]|nr:GDSL-type esterase/lipase family protein [Bacteroidota bacterium]